MREVGVFCEEISLVLTSANPPLFLLRKTGPGLTSVPIFLHFIWHAATACLNKRCAGARLGSEPRPPVAELAHLTAKPPGRPLNILLLFCVCVRKISPELTSMPILLFLLRKTGIELTSVPIFLHFIWDTATAWPDKLCVGAPPDPNPATSSRAWALNHYATGMAPI